VNKLFFFSTNVHKIKEVKKILKKRNYTLLTLNDFPKIIEPKENGNTFQENASIKSNFGFKKFGLPCFADDSGICISALNNLPGVYSKRFKKENGGIKKTFKKITEETIKNNNFKAFFQTTISFTYENNTIYFNGIVKGTIAKKPLGTFGFDYDPIFIPLGQKKAYAQMLLREKNLISHRAVALKKFIKFLQKSFN
tara:strand:- start:299 stop:886 length:588 start_codon:yes stop_codon:yes gene_type:complete